MIDIEKDRLFCCGPFFFVLVAFILSQIASKRCQYLSVPDGTYLNARYLASDVGIWCFTMEGGTTVTYSEDGRINESVCDGTFRAAQGFSVASTALGAIVIIVMVLVPCCAPLSGPRMYGGVGILLLLTCLMEGLTFLMLQSELCTCPNEPNGCACELTTGGNCGIAAAVFWFVSALLSCGMAKADPGSTGER
mmetsp:Transcript_18367/g.52988  ORF Transcript_18367/g.52988 Transcript_18367/m.52988 type:complete len:193 (-) Transcript_18367:50-628(-)